MNSTQDSSEKSLADGTVQSPTAAFCGKGLGARRARESKVQSREGTFGETPKETRETRVLPGDLNGAVEFRRPILGTLAFPRGLQASLPPKENDYEKIQVEVGFDVEPVVGGAAKHPG
jgi:hypothetical protein